MEAVGKFGRQKPIDETVTGEPVEARKASRDDSHAVMRFPAGTSAAVPRMPVGFVNNVETLRFEALRQTSDNSFLHSHAPVSR